MTYQQREVLIYIWCTLNNEKQLILKLQDYKLIKNLLHEMCITIYDKRYKEVSQKGGKELGKRLEKLPDYRRVTDCIYDKHGLDSVKPNLNLRNNKKHREIVNQNLKAYS